MSQDEKSDRLDRAMRQWAGQAAELSLPPGLEQKLLGEFSRVTGQRRRRTWMSAASIAAAIVVAVWMNSHEPVTSPAAKAAVQQPTSQATSAAVVEAPFVPIPYVTSPGPFERVQVVRMEMPVAALIAAGIPVGSVDAGAQVEADVVVGQDGRAHAVRVISAQASQF